MIKRRKEIGMEFICAEEKQWKEIKTIYMEAFPKRERKPYFALRHSVKTKKAVVMAATEGEQVLGFIVLIPYKDMVMADYLAVSSKVRSRGTGSYIMQNVCRQYKDKKIVLLIERLDDKAENKEQKNDILSVYVDEKGKPYKTAGKIDYVAGWYFKAAQFMQGTTIRTAFVSTNSITQGEQVAGVWKPLYDRFGIHIDFAHRTFMWDSEANMKAHVHCVIVGFSIAPNQAKRRIYVDGRFKEVNNVNAYLLDAPNEFICNRSKPLWNVPQMTTGNRPADGGNLIIEKEDYEEFIRKEPQAKPYIKKLVGSTEFINNKERWCLWLVDVKPAELRKMPLVLKRVEACKQDRENSPDAGRRKLAETPTLFRELNNPASFILVPKVSSERRRYVPMGFLDYNTISTDLNFIIPEATMYQFAILTSNIHMAWMRAVCGRMKSDYRYSANIVYNNFPWPEPTAQQRKKIEQTAQAILDARALYPDSSLADLYDELTMPLELRKAHHQNDMAVMQAYGFTKGSEAYKSEAACVAELMKLYQKKVEEIEKR